MGRKRARSKALVRARKRGTATGFQSGGGGGEAAAGDNAQAADAAEAGFGFDSAPARPVSNRHADGECARAFASYYRAQGIVPEAEWPRVEAALRRPLPVTFRTNASAGAQAAVRAALEEAQHLLRPPGEGPYAYTDRGRPVERPFELPWCRGWQLGLDSGALKFSSDETLQATRKWLIRNGAIGLVLRQAVDSMLPVALLGVQPGHTVLDMCASPGSKTTQCVEALHAGGGEPAGVVIANDVSPQRAYTLVRRCDALGAAAARLAIVCHPAQRLPAFARGGVDRIVCDVPCCGDGTLRKNPEIWQRWAPNFGKGLHSLQLQIAMRGLALLKVGGVLSYSTCTFNPLENEAVVAELLRRTRGCVELVDVSDRLPELPRRPGVATWKVCGDDMRWIDTHEQSQTIADRAERRRFRASMWPPPPGSDISRVLRRCCRIVPHLADTGGFFVAILRKVKPWPDAGTQEGAALPPPLPPPQRAESPIAARAEREFRPRALDGAARIKVREALGTDSDSFDRFVAPGLSRRAAELPAPVWHAASELVPMLDRLHVVRGGVKVFVPGAQSAAVRKSGTEPLLELTAEGAELLAAHGSGRAGDASVADARLLLAAPNTIVALKKCSKALRAAFSGLAPGACIVRVPTAGSDRRAMSGVLSDAGLQLRFHASRGREHGPKAACAAVLRTLPAGKQ